jgi:hypothetical protein
MLDSAGDECSTIATPPPVAAKSRAQYQTSLRRVPTLPSALDAIFFVERTTLAHGNQ